MKILGISAFYHDSAAALIEDGRIVAAAQEERFSRVKHDARFPEHAVRYCLEEAGCKLEDVALIAFFEKPFIKFERLLETYLAFAPRGLKSFAKAMPVWLDEKLFQERMLVNALHETTGVEKKTIRAKLCYSEHHLSHAASAFYASPFEEALTLTMDGVGEWTTTSLGIGRGRELQIVKELHFPHSLGLLYSAFTYYCGFRVNSGEYKLMGLAPYGTPRYEELIYNHLMDLKPDGTFRLDMDYFDYCTGLTMTNNRFADLFGAPARRPDHDPLTQEHMDLAASVQAVTEEVVRRLVRSVVDETGIRRLCLAGGVALNCVANGKIVREKLVDELWIQPAAGDAGGALGAAQAAWHLYKEQPRVALGAQEKDLMQGSYLGPSYAQEDIEARLRAAGAVFEVLEETALYDRLSDDLIAERAVGWHQGRMEFGPRALGGRSILGDPRSPKMQSVLNLKVKFRESFRPFAPSVLEEQLGEWFDLEGDSPYMLLVAPVHPNRCIEMNEEQKQLFGIEKLNVPRSEIPAVTHVDYSARIQTVSAAVNPRYHALISAFHAKTGCPLLVNTSFNVRGEPIVNTPEDAFRCFMGTGIERLTVGNCYLKKEDQDPALLEDYKDRFALD